MKKSAGFILMNIAEFRDWILNKNVNRKVTMIHNHHTYIPDYSHFKNNHFHLVTGMKNYHMNIRRFADIGQQITTFPDGMVVVGTRSLEVGPACIRKNNDSAVCIEHVGNFDKGGDVMTAKHKKTIVFVNALLHLKFALAPNDTHNVYHHWFDLASGERVDGVGGGTKSCPGSNFFGGNKPRDARKNFLPLVSKVLKKQPEYAATFGVEIPEPIGYAMVIRANFLNVRTGPGSKNKKLGTISRGNTVDIYERVPRWTRISPDQKWVSSYYLQKIYKGFVNDEDPKGLSVRTGPSSKNRKVDALLKNTAVTVFEMSENGWYRISFLDLWVYGKYITLN